MPRKEYGSTWNGSDDPENNYNWPSWRKITIGVIFPLGQLVTLMSASMIAAALGDISRDLRIDDYTAMVIFSTYIFYLLSRSGHRTFRVSGGITLTGPVMADVYGKRERGKSLAIASFLPYLGPALGPIFGGIIAQLVVWPWIVWIISIFNSFITLAGYCFIRESYTPVLLRRKAKSEAEFTYDAERTFIAKC
ncbi:hypothetical protein BELL_0345g00070 [Botrytis elliptica]|uniref:Major facilitator superfamily (MFS) profile domain-containing protein n=1 Tax=Botrytis elliptica TaxID=278938 RepID=A0A4Z1JWU8_9HELO|nr:hypothetical protein EAE99_011905 [Botrytis elliptica]TGO73633.1 hypothetical protein BELL_0345g00070 [Botrytis elliptica]